MKENEQSRSKSLCQLFGKDLSVNHGLYLKMDNMSYEATWW